MKIGLFLVFDILLRVSEGKSWQAAILGVLPSRKGATALPDGVETNTEEIICDTEEASTIEPIEKEVITTV